MQKCRANSTRILPINQTRGVARRTADERQGKRASRLVSSHSRYGNRELARPRNTDTVFTIHPHFGNNYRSIDYVSSSGAASFSSLSSLFRGRATPDNVDRMFLCLAFYRVINTSHKIEFYMRNVAVCSVILRVPPRSSRCFIDPPHEATVAYLHGSSGGQIGN